MKQRIRKSLGAAILVAAVVYFLLANQISQAEAGSLLDGFGRPLRPVSFWSLRLWAGPGWWLLDLAVSLGGFIFGSKLLFTPGSRVAVQVDKLVQLLKRTLKHVVQETTEALKGIRSTPKAFKDALREDQADGQR